MKKYFKEWEDHLDQEIKYWEAEVEQQAIEGGPKGMDIAKTYLHSVQVQRALLVHLK